jgi:hypothetical protein
MVGEHHFLRTRGKGKCQEKAQQYMSWFHYSNSMLLALACKGSASRTQNKIKKHFLFYFILHFTRLALLCWREYRRRLNKKIKKMLFYFVLYSPCTIFAENNKNYKHDEKVYSDTMLHISGIEYISPRWRAKDHRVDRIGAHAGGAEQ